MTLFTYPNAFAPVKADGTPNRPDLGQADVLMKELMNTVQMALFDGLIYSTRAALYADLAHPANSWALVIGDPTAGYDGMYQKSGGSGSGSWSRKGDVPGSGFIAGTDSGAGTANAIQVTSSPIPATDGAALISFNIYETNTSSPVTVSFNGDTALTIKTNSGNDVTAGGLVAGMVVAGFKSGTTFRIISDQVSAALLAEMEDLLAEAMTYLNSPKPLLTAVRVLTTADTATATAMENGDTLDGVTLATGDRVAKAYNGATGAASNGIWIVQASGAAVRATDADSDAELRASSFYVEAGTHEGELWSIRNTSAITVDSTAIVIQKARDAVGYEGEVIAARGDESSLGDRLDTITANDISDVTTDTPTLLRTSTTADTALVRYDAPSRGLVAPGADRPHAGGPIEIFIGFGQSKMANRTAVPPINTVIRRPFRSLMFTEVGTMGIGTDDITTFDLSKIGPARAFEGDSLEGESYWNSFAYQLLAREDEAKLAPAAKFFFNCALGGTDILTLTARKYATWSALNAAPGTLAGEIATVPTTDAGTHTDPVVGGTVANSGTFRWSASPAGWERTAATVQNMYANMIAGVNYLYKHFRGNVVVRCVLCDQGESNEADSQATYTTYVQRFYDMLEADLQAINAGIFGYYADGTAKRLPTLWNHTPIRNTESTVGAGYGWGTQDALIALDVTARTLPLTARRIVVGCSAYDRPYVDSSHYNVHGTILKGADLAEAFWKLETSGWVNAGTFKMISAVIDGSDILVSTNSPSALTIETSAPYRNWSSTTAGFALRDAADVAQTITAVAIDTNTTKIRITPAAAPSAGWRVLAGRKATVLTSPGPGAGTNIRTTSTAVCELRPNRALHQFLLGSEITVS